VDLVQVGLGDERWRLRPADVRDVVELLPLVHHAEDLLQALPVRLNGLRVRLRRGEVGLPELFPIVRRRGQFAGEILVDPCDHFHRQVVLVFQRMRAGQRGRRQVTGDP
jgi:hypothetical protein